MTRLDAIRQRLERATLEPVVVGEKGGPAGMHSVVNRRGNILGMFPAKRDAEWYAHSREDIPALLAVAESVAKHIHDGPVYAVLAQLLQEVEG